MFLKLSWGNSNVYYNFSAKNHHSCAILISKIEAGGGELEKDKNVDKPLVRWFLTNVAINLNLVTDCNPSR